MNYLSVCSGIEAATVALHPLGWRPLAFSEVAPFPSAVLAHRFPTVTNLGDMLLHHEWKIPRSSVDALIGGTPCQPFAPSGYREGFADPRGNLTLGFLGLLAQFRPRWFIWENVPRILADDRGAFGAFIGGVALCGYGFAYRVLDSQFFGVPQKRRRLYLVGCAGGDWRRAAAALFEPGWLPGDSEPCGSQGQGDPPGFTEGPGDSSGRSRLFRLVSFGQYLEDGRASNMQARDHKGATDLILTPRPDGSRQVRRLTPVERERLQGFPDNFTRIPWNGRPEEECPDGPRVHAIGNSMTVPVIRWLGERITAADQLEDSTGGSHAHPA